MMEKELGKIIRKKREDLNLSREDFCADGKGISVRQLSRIENGESVPSLKKLQYISYVLKEPISIFFDEVGI